MMLQQEKKYRGPFGHLSTSSENRVNPQFQTAQIFMAQERAKQEQIKEPIIKADTPTKKRVKKEKIPATLKNIVWHKYFETSLTGLCQCCKVENISKAIFDAGHIISEKNGGQVVLENLKPICKLCNSSMGKTNMDEFMKKYGI
jgi:5-methylcytosine-specific restriction endonuclease McrA